MLQHLQSTEDQSATIEALASGAATGEGGPLQRIDTHMSHLFLGRERVYKLKRSRRHPFVDLSSLAARQRCCEAELTVNKALAPDLYESFRPVTRAPDGVIRVGGDGDVVDWVVVMRRFPDQSLLLDLAEAGELTPALARDTAEVVARFHAAQPSEPQVGRPVDYERILAGLRKTEAEAAADLGVTPTSRTLFEALDHEVSRLSPLIEARRRAGWVRRGHGDLHLRNICLVNGQVTPFDALEFDPTLATADVLYDTAFLLMDLHARGLRGLANVAMNRYWDAAGQPESALALLPLFMALRAAVRMAVAVEAQDLVEAARYRALALELLKPVKPRLVAVGGLSGSGKSTVAEALAPDVAGSCGGRVLRSDVIRKALAEVEESASLPQQAYEPAARARIYRALAGRAREALAAGISAVVDATFQEAHARAAIEGVAGDHSFIGLWLRGSPESRVARIAARRKGASDATPAVALAQAEPRGFSSSWRVLDADLPLSDVLREARKALGATP